MGHNALKHNWVLCGHWLLARRSLADPAEIAYYACYKAAPRRRLLNSLVQARAPDPDGIWSWSRWRRRRQ